MRLEGRWRGAIVLFEWRSRLTDLGAITPEAANPDWKAWQDHHNKAVIGRGWAGSERTQYIDDVRIRIKLKSDAIGSTV